MYYPMLIVDQGRNCELKEEYEEPCSMPIKPLYDVDYD